MNKIIEIVVAADGQSMVQTKGFAGEECRQASRILEETLGRQATETLTAEFYQPRALSREKNSVSS